MSSKKERKKTLDLTKQALLDLSNHLQASFGPSDGRLHTAASTLLPSFHRLVLPMRPPITLLLPPLSLPLSIGRHCNAHAIWVRKMGTRGSWELKCQNLVWEQQKLG